MKLIITEEQLRLIVEFSTKQDSIEYFYNQLNKLGKMVGGVSDPHEFIINFLKDKLLDIITMYYILDVNEVNKIERNIKNLINVKKGLTKNHYYLSRSIFADFIFTLNKDNTYNVADYDKVVESMNGVFDKVDEMLEEIRLGDKKRVKEPKNDDDLNYGLPRMSDTFEKGSEERRIYELERGLYNIEKLMFDGVREGLYNFSEDEIENIIKMIRDYYDNNKLEFDYNSLSDFKIPNNDKFNKFLKQELKNRPGLILN